MNNKKNNENDLNNENFTFCSVESYTGGAFSAQIIKTPGASKYFKGSFVPYWNESKNLIKINTLNGVINSSCAIDMALKGKDFFSTSLCVSFSGNAGPIPMENNQVGLCYISFNDQCFKLEFNLKNRNEIINDSVNFAIDKINQILKNKNINFCFEKIKKIC